VISQQYVKLLSVQEKNTQQTAWIELTESSEFESSNLKSQTNIRAYRLLTPAQLETSDNDKNFIELHLVRAIH